MVDRLMEAEAEITRLHQERERWIDYTTDLQRIIEALCDRRGLPEPVSTARHHYNMAREHLAAERLAGARVVQLRELIASYRERFTDEKVDYQRAILDTLDNIKMVLDGNHDAAALAEPAGEAEPVACVACEDRPKGENNPCAVCGKAATPPDASAVRGALESDQWSIIDRAIERYSNGEISDLHALGLITSGFLKLDAERLAALAGAKP